MKNNIYKHPVFNLIYPTLQQDKQSPATAFFHKEFCDIKNPPWNLSQIFYYIIGDWSADLSQDTIQYYNLMYQQAFEQIRNR